MLEKVAWMNLLYGFYGQLLTDRQNSYMDLYYGQNLSLGEIAEEFSVTRQAVYDTLKRSEQILQLYEDKLGLVARYNEDRKKLSAVLDLLEQYLAGAGGTDNIEKAKDILIKILDLL